MTNLEAIRANMSDAHGVVLTQNHFVKALADVGLVADGEYSNSTAIDRATITLYDIILGGAGLSEGGLNYSFQLSGVVAAKAALLEKLNGVSSSVINSVKPW